MGARASSVIHLNYFLRGSVGCPFPLYSLIGQNVAVVKPALSASIAACELRRPAFLSEQTPFNTAFARARTSPGVTFLKFSDALIGFGCVVFPVLLSAGKPAIFLPTNASYMTRALPFESSDASLEKSTSQEFGRGCGPRSSQPYRCVRLKIGL
jgi:hypothetical protein